MDYPKLIIIYENDEENDDEPLYCDECDNPVLDSKKCDNCGDVLCEDCQWHEGRYYEYDNNIVFCFACLKERQRECEEEE